MDNYDCTCHGLNSNCFRCYGTGLVENATPIIGRPHRNLANANVTSRLQPSSKRISTKAKTREYTVCEICFTTIRSSRLQQHLSKAHSNKLQLSAVETSNSNLVEFTAATASCPICKKQAKNINELGLHLIKEHGQYLKGSNKNRNKTSTAPYPKASSKLNIPITKKFTFAARAGAVQQRNIDDVDALDHPSRLPGSYGMGKRR